MITIIFLSLTLFFQVLTIMSMIGAHQETKRQIRDIELLIKAKESMK